MTLIYLWQTFKLQEKVHKKKILILIFIGNYIFICTFRFLIHILKEIIDIDWLLLKLKLLHQIYAIFLAFFCGWNFFFWYWFFYPCYLCFLNRNSFGKGPEGGLFSVYWGCFLGSDMVVGIEKVGMGVWGGGGGVSWVPVANGVYPPVLVRPCASVHRS